MEEEIYKSPVTIRKQTDKFTGKSNDLNDFTKELKDGGVAGFNSWARNNDRYGLDLRGIRLSNIDLHGINLRKARLDKSRLLNVKFNDAILSGISMDKSIGSNVNFEKADLTDAFLQNGRFTGGSMQNANLYGAHLRKTKFLEVDFSYANLNGADLRGSTLKDVTVTGINAWAIDTDSKTVQENLKIVPFLYPYEDVLREGEDEIILSCDDIEVAHLLYLLTRRNKKDRSEKVKQVINALTDKIVLILGNFRRQRKFTLKKIREKLAQMDYVPVIFDFSIPKDRDMIETIGILAGLSRFVIADFTSQSSIPLESMLIISGYKVPFKPVIRKGQKIFSMFSALKEKYDWVLDKWEYESNEHLLKNLEAKVIDDCERKRTLHDGRKKEIEKERLKNLLKAK